MRRYLVFGCLLAAMAAGITQAGAYFTEQVSVAENVITVGEVAMSAEPTASALSIPVIAPGQTVEKTLTLRNDGTLDADAVVTGAKKAGYTAVYEALTCTVSHAGSVLYQGPLAMLRTDPVRIGAADAETLTFALGLPADADDGIQGDYVKLTLYADAEQVHP
jgi:hypothetical protein